MLRQLQALAREGESFDVVVIGAGGAGMSAALCAAIDGARVLLVERTGHVGGTTAYSGGTTWIPGTRHGKEVAQDDTIAVAEAYLTRAIGERTPAALRRAFLERGAEALDFVEANSQLRYRAYPTHPDYLSEIEGSTERGRALEPLPFDGRKLGPLFPLVRPPIPEFTVLGGMMVDRNDIGHLLAMRRSLRSARHAARILLRHAMDRLRHPRGTRLVMGNALIGRLLHSLAQRKNVTLLLDTSVTGIERDRTGVTAVTLEGNGTTRRVRAMGGMILATGGFNRDASRRARLLPGVDMTWCPGAPGHTGEAHALAESAGARYGEGALSPAFWAPVSIRRRADGTTAVFPHFLMDRGKPGTMIVKKDGKRFVNETTSYHLLGLAMQAEDRRSPAIPAYLVASAEAVRKYGIGMVRPGGKGHAPFVADGYLCVADTLDELARKLDIDPRGLAESAAKMAAYAATGVDADFGRGVGAYARNLGDPIAQGANRCLGTLGNGPFHAVRIYPGDIGAATGFVTDQHAQMLDADGAPIPGLYAVGNDMHSVMGGVYTGPGITLGPGLVFGYIAGRHAAARARDAARAAGGQAK